MSGATKYEALRTLGMVAESEPCDAAMWNDMLAFFLSSSAPWPEGACRFDLRVMVGQVKAGVLDALPSRRFLAARWRISEHRARMLLLEETARTVAP